jgi:hypothetical protein
VRSETVGPQAEPGSRKLKMEEQEAAYFHGSALRRRSLSG